MQSSAQHTPFRLSLDLVRGPESTGIFLNRFVGLADSALFRALLFRETLTEAAELSGSLLHDFRRSAVRNMIRRGVPQKTAMKVSGHKTDAIFSRYNIVSEADLRDAVRKIEQGAKAEIHSSFTVAQECSNSEEAAESAEARKPGSPRERAS